MCPLKGTTGSNPVLSSIIDSHPRENIQLILVKSIKHKLQFCTKEHICAGVAYL